MTPLCGNQSWLNFIWLDVIYRKFDWRCSTRSRERVSQTLLVIRVNIQLDKPIVQFQCRKLTRSLLNQYITVWLLDETLFEIRCISLVKGRRRLKTLNNTSSAILFLPWPRLSKKTNQEKTKIGPFFDFLLHFSIFLLEISSIASQLSFETMFKSPSKNIEKCRT